MIGEIVHVTRTNNQASQRPVCHPAVVMKDLPNDHKDVLTFVLNATDVGQTNIAKGAVTKVGAWHYANHKENQE